MTSAAPRYAIFYAPPAGCDFARFGGEWLGWDASAGCEASPPAPPENWERITRRPRKYGFHGTLKPPFRLADGFEVEGLQHALSALARRYERITAAPLMLSRMGRLLALVPSEPCPALGRLATDIVTRLDPFRAPATEAETARRRVAALSDRQEGYLRQYGYPYVLDEFRFHLTLTGALRPEDAERIEAELRARTAQVTAQPFEITEICLFCEGEDGRFRVMDRFELAAPSADDSSHHHHH